MDPWNYVMWDRPDVFAVPTAAELQGPVTRVNLLDHLQTGLPLLTTDDLTNYTLGSYGVSLCDGYVTAMVVSTYYCSNST